MLFDSLNPPPRMAERCGGCRSNPAPKFTLITVEAGQAEEEAFGHFLKAVGVEPRVPPTKNLVVASLLVPVSPFAHEALR
jgi:hypothetical protein